MSNSLATLAKFPLLAVKSGVVWETYKCGQSLNTAQFAEVYFIIQNLKNLVTLAFCSLLQCFTKKGCQKSTDNVNQ